MPAADRRLPLLLLFLCCCVDVILHPPSSSAVLGSSLFHGRRKVSQRSCVQRHVFSPHRNPLSPSEPQFALKVLLRDLVTRQALSGASVDVYMNHTLTGSAQAGEIGEVLLWVSYSPGLSLTLLGHKEGYVPTPLPWSTSKRPIFSAVTMLLLPHSQGNIWLFEDSVLITGKLPDGSSHPKVKFPKNLLALADNGNISSLMAYLTVPQHHLEKDCANCTPGVISKT
uniref:Family with sequence similarity 171 member B n=1 Tax=Nothobranchius furzeri TaxID=105023 RepID=A0A8C6LMW2_NOTFU